MNGYVLHQAPVAQWTEPQTSNLWGGGSNPSRRASCSCTPSLPLSSCAHARTMPCHGSLSTASARWSLSSFHSIVTDKLGTPTKRPWGFGGQEFRCAFVTVCFLRLILPFLTQLRACSRLNEVIFNHLNQCVCVTLPIISVDPVRL